MTTAIPTARRGPDAPPVAGPGAARAERVELLLAAMTLEEKVAQLGSRWVGNDMQADPTSSPSRARPSTLNVAPMQDVFAASGTVPLEEASRHGLGHLTRVYGSAPVTAGRGRRRAGPPAARSCWTAPGSASRRWSTRSA